MKFRARAIGAALAILMAAVFKVSAGGAFAQEGGAQNSLSLEIKAQKEVRIKKDGEWTVKYEPAEKTRRGDLLLYTIRYRNDHDFAVQNASIVDPVPEGAVYLLGSAVGEGTAILFSIDGGEEFQKPPVMYSGVDESGKETVLPAPAEMYTHIKWLIVGPVLSGAGGEASFKIKVK